MTHTLKLIVGMAVGFGAAIAVVGWREHSWRYIALTLIAVLIFTKLGVGPFKRLRRPR